MAKVTVYGASDDLIEVDGPGTLNEEFYLGPNDSDFLRFSDGTVLSVKYTDGGLWKIERIEEGSAVYEKVHNASDPDTDDYSDRVTLDGVTWVKWEVGP